jgi:hypothetical protein
MQKKSLHGKKTSWRSKKRNNEENEGRKKMEWNPLLKRGKTKRVP